MKIKDIIVESSNMASAEQIWDYVGGIHPKDQQGGGFLKRLIMRNPQYELKRVPLSSLHVPNDEDDGDDPYGRAMFVDVDHAREYSQHHVDKKPVVADAEGHILDGAHRAWAAAELLNRTDIMAWVPAKKLAEDESLDKGFSLGNMLPWPEVVNKINSAMKAMGWKGQRKDDGSFIFTTRGAMTDEYYIVIIDNRGDSMFTYALGTVEEGDPHIGEQDALPTTEASVSELMNAIRDGFGLNENFADGKNPGRKGLAKRSGVDTKASVSSLRKTAKNSSGEKQRMAHWLANMKAGRAKAKKK